MTRPADSVVIRNSSAANGRVAEPDRVVQARHGWISDSGSVADDRDGAVILGRLPNVLAIDVGRGQRLRDVGSCAVALQIELEQAWDCQLVLVSEFADPLANDPSRQSAPYHPGHLAR